MHMQLTTRESCSSSISVKVCTKELQYSDNLLQNGYPTLSQNAEFNQISIHYTRVLLYTAKLLQNSMAMSVSEVNPCPHGQVHIIIGPMFAGKSTALLRRVKSESNIGRKVAMIKSSKDTRYATDAVVTHDGVKFPCWALPDLSSFKHSYGVEAYDQLDVIGIDEAQFFDDLYDFCCMAADDDGKTIIVAGLDGDYLRRSFGSVLDVVPLADTITKLTARCELCGKKASFTLRKTHDTRTELIGGSDVYMPVCRQHYVASHVVEESAKNIPESHEAESALIPPNVALSV